MAKTLYHSELVKLSPVQVTVKTDVLDSKFKDKPPYVGLKIDGEERNYSTENDECAAFFDGQKGRTFTIVAEGREDDATITYVGESAAPVEDAQEAPEAPPARRPSRAPARPPARRQSAPPAKGEGTPPPPPPAPPSAPSAPARPPAAKPPVETPEQRVQRARQHANKVANVWLIAYAAGNFARQQVREQFQQELSETQFQACVSTIAVQLEKDGFHHQMPVGVLNIAPKAQPAEPAPQPPAAPEPSDNDGAAN